MLSTAGKNSVCTTSCLYVFMPYLSLGSVTGSVFNVPKIAWLQGWLFKYVL